MNTINAILVASPDGTLHLPLPAGLQAGTLKVMASVERVPDGHQPAKPGLWVDLPGGFWIAADFDEPLDDFKEDMG
jgi:hypothetical protein